jgi:XTP/dITP diphosphohydrolase
MNHWVLASGNAGKLREFAVLLAPLQIKIQAQSEFNLPACDEPFNTFLENALHKARHASLHTGLPALADDSGICLPALNGAPGVRSARFALEQGFVAPALNFTNDPDQLNNLALQQALSRLDSGSEAIDRRAYYACVLVLVRHPQDPRPLVAQAAWWGVLQAVPQGDAGFGYDPYFFVPQFNCTAAQLSVEQKNQVGHRGQAMRDLLRQVQHGV